MYAATVIYRPGGWVSERDIPERNQANPERFTSQPDTTDAPTPS